MTTPGMTAVTLYHVDIRRDQRDVMTSSALSAYLATRKSGTAEVPDFAPAPSMEMRLTLASAVCFNYASVEYGGMTFYYFVEPVAYDFAPLISLDQFAQTQRFTLDVPHTFAIDPYVSMRAGSLLTRSHVLGEYDNFDTTAAFHGIPETATTSRFFDRDVYGLQDPYNLEAGDVGKYRLFMHVTATDTAHDGNAVYFLIMTPSKKIPRGFTADIENFFVKSDNLTVGTGGDARNYNAPRLLDLYAIPASWCANVITAETCTFSRGGTTYDGGNVIDFTVAEGSLECYNNVGVAISGTSLQGCAFKLGNANTHIEHGATPLNPYGAIRYFICYYPNMGGIRVSVEFCGETLDLTDSCRVPLTTTDAVANRLATLQGSLALGSSALNVGASVVGLAAGAANPVSLVLGARGVVESLGGAVQTYAARKYRSAARQELAGGFVFGSQPPIGKDSRIHLLEEYGGQSVAYFVKSNDDPNVTDEKHLYGYSSAPVPPRSLALIRGYNYTYYEGDVRVAIGELHDDLAVSLGNFRHLYRDELERILSAGCRIWETATGYGNADGRVILH